MFRTNAWNRLRYTLISPIYNAILPFARPMRRRSLALLNVQPNERILIIGAGTGLDLDNLPRDANIIATDLTAAMLAKLHHRARALQMSRTKIVRADAQRLCFPDSSFDAVILHFILAVVPDPIATISEVQRVLKPAARAVVLDKFAPDDRPTPLVLRALNPVSNMLVTEVTRKLHTIIGTTKLKIVEEEPLALGGFFKLALLRRP